MLGERDFNKIETRAVIKFLFLQGKASKEIHTILTETLACFLPGWGKDSSAPLLPDGQTPNVLYSGEWVILGQWFCRGQQQYNVFVANTRRILLKYTLHYVQLRLVTDSSSISYLLHGAESFLRS